MEVFMMAIETDSPHKSSVLMCVCCLVANNENAGSVLLKQRKPNEKQQCCVGVH